MASLISEKIKNKYSFKKRPILNLEIKLSSILIKKNILLQKLFVFLNQKNRIDKILKKLIYFQIWTLRNILIFLILMDIYT